MAVASDDDGNDDGSLISRHRSRFVNLGSARTAAVAFAAGGMSVLAFAPFFLFPILYATLPMLVLLIDGSRGPKQAAVRGWWFAFGYFVFGLFWIGEAFLVEADKFAWLLPFAVTLLPAGLALFWALAAAVSKLFWRPGVSRVFVLAASLAVAEWLRGTVLSGFPWNVLGYALTSPLSLMQSASIGGVYSLTIVAVILFALPVVIMMDAPKRGRRRAIVSVLIGSVLPLGLLFAWGNWRAGSIALSDVSGTAIRVVQPNVAQKQKWRPEFQREIFERHLALSQTNARGVIDGAAGITHIVWPEAAMPFLPLERPEATAAIADAVPEHAVLLAGALRREPLASDGAPSRRGYNSLIVFDDKGSPISIYDKIHLVPFGEYLPIEPVLSRLGLTRLAQGHGSFLSGQTPRPVLAVPGLPPVLPAICYEMLFPGSIVQGSLRPGVIVNVTNDGWFGNTTGPQQHFHQARVRAVELGLPLIRSANNGISAVIDPVGRVRGQLEMNVAGVIDSPLPEALAATLFARFGNGMFAIAVAVAMLIAAATGRQARRR